MRAYFGHAQNAELIIELYFWTAKGLEVSWLLVSSEEGSLVQGNLEILKRNKIMKQEEEKYLLWPADEQSLANIMWSEEYWKKSNEKNGQSEYMKCAKRIEKREVINEYEKRKRKQVVKRNVMK